MGCFPKSARFLKFSEMIPALPAEKQPPEGGCFRLSEKPKDFSDSLKKCRYFSAVQRRKSPRCAR